MNWRRRQHRQRYAERGWARQDPDPLWDDAEESWEDPDDEDWDDDESWEEPDGFWGDSGDDGDLSGDVGARPRDDENLDWESRVLRDALDREH